MDSKGPVVRRLVRLNKYFEFFGNPFPQLWDLIETWGFREDLKGIVLHHTDDDNNNKDDKDGEEDNYKDEDKDNNDCNNFSA